ncbi:MAG: transposase [Rubrivivax sp.]
MGESKLATRMAVKPVVAASREAIDTRIEAAREAMRVHTPGGVFAVRWDERGRATALGQLAFFAEYLETSGLFEAWLESCPLSYTSPNAPALVDVLGTWMLSILDGHCRYAHVGALRGDGVAPSILGMNKIIGDDSLRRALSAIAPAPDDKHTDAQRAAQQIQLARSTQWMQAQLKHSIAQATATPWILDCDTTIKVLYGRQDGAVVSYNPHKPGRPSHAIHTYWIGNLRLVLDAQLDSGNRHSPVHARPALLALLEDMPAAARPKLVRGDCAFGSEGEMSALEVIGQPYLFKLRQSPGVKTLIKRQWTRRDWTSVGQGWEACEDVLRLTGWTQSRRVIVMRRVRKLDLIVEVQGEVKGEVKVGVKRSGRGRGKDAAQAKLHFIDENEPVKSWEYAVLVCNAHYELQKHRAAVPRPRRLRERLRRDQEPMGLGWLQHARHRTLRAQRAGRGAGLQLVELVRAAGSSEDALGGHHEPAQAAQRGGQADQPWRAEEGLAQRHARSGRADQAADRQCPRRFEPYSSDRAAVGQAATLVRAGALHRRANPGLSAQA